MKYYDGMGRDVSDYVASLEMTIAELKAKLDGGTAQIKFQDPAITGIVETEPKPKPRRRTEPVADT